MHYAFHFILKVISNALLSAYNLNIRNFMDLQIADLRFFKKIEVTIIYISESLCLIC